LAPPRPTRSNPLLSRRTIIAGIAAAPVFTRPGAAQAKYPDRPIRVIVPFGPGGLADVTIRIIGEKMSERFGQQVVVVNTPGAGGIAAAKAVQAAPADGYTLALFTNGTAISVPLMKSLGFDPVKEFTPVSSLGFFDFLILTSADHPYKTFADLLAAAKAKPGALNAGTINIGSTQNLTATLFGATAGVSFTTVPHRTTPDAIAALLRKDVDFVVEGYVAARGLMQDGKIRALASTGPTRSPSTPNVPTMDESGVKGFDVTSWNAVFALAGTPPDIIAQLNAAIVAAVADPVVKQKLLDLGIEARGGAPAAIAQRLVADIAKWGDVIEKAGVPKQ
jgi:tripartite-type tricarboxylate transporter receptor subunit TctC